MKALRWRGWLAALAIFVLGSACGAAGMAWMGRRMLRELLQSPASEVGPADRAAARIGAELTKELKLTPDEAARVQALLDESAGRLKAVRVDAAQRALAELRASTERIAAVLPPEKRAEFYRLSARRSEWLR